MRLFTLALVFIFQISTSIAQERPNIVLINIDDMGWRDLGIMGSDYYQTPFLDSLAEQSLVFEQAYAAAANCAPSRASMLTGLWATRHKIYTVASSERGKTEDRKIIPTKNTLFFDPAFTTFPQILQKNGYSTLHAGKWHVSKNPRDFGFDNSIGGGPEGSPRNYSSPYGLSNWEGPEDDYLSDAIMDKTIRSLSELERPFFLYYSPYAVHTPIQGKSELAKKYHSINSEIGQKNPEYASMVENLDRNLASLFSALQSREMLENTMVIFTTDNGGLKGITSQTPLRSGKGSYYEGGIRVPFFIFWKGKINPGRDKKSLITQMDIFPTLMEILDLNNEIELDGRSLWPTISKGEPLDQRRLFWHFPIYLQAYSVPDPGIRDPKFRTRPGSVIRDGDWKLQYYFEDQDFELFHLKDDPSEQNDLSSTRPEKAQELLKLLQNWWEETEAPIPTKPNPSYEGL